MKCLSVLTLGLFLSLSSFANEKTPEAVPRVDVEITESELTSASFILGRHSFGQIPVGTSRSVDLWIRNNTSMPVEIYGIYTDGFDFSFIANCGYYLYPGDYCSARTTFHPSYHGSFSGFLDFNLSNGTYSFELMGRGY